MTRYTRAATGIVASIGFCLLVTGCAADRHEDIPKSAPMVAKGETDLTWNAPNDGMAYIYDQTEGKLLYSGRVQRGENLVVDAREDRIQLSGRTVMDKQIRDHNEVEIFFQEDRLSREARQARDERRPAESRVIVEQPRRDADNSRIVVEPEQRQGNRVTVEPKGGEGNRVTVEPGRGDSKITVE